MDRREIASDPSSLDDTIGHIATLEGIFRERLALTPIAVPDAIVGYRSDESFLDTHVWSAPKVDRLTLYRYFSKGRLKEHLGLLFPDEHHNLPALAMVIFEFEGTVRFSSDFIPADDPVFVPDYYARYLSSYKDLVYRWWPRFQEYNLTPNPPPNAYFNGAIASSLAVMMHVRPEGLAMAMEYQREVVRCWLDVWEQAEPVPEQDRARYQARRRALIQHYYKPMDYHSPASPSLAQGIGWERTNMLFDAVFGPDDDGIERPLNEQRVYRP